MTGKRIAAWLLVALTFALGLPLPRHMASAAEPLRVGKADAHTTVFLPVDIGQRLGFFKKHGVAVEVSNFAGGSKVTQAMIAGGIDIGLNGGIEMAFVAKGAPMRAVCEIMGPIAMIGIAVPYQSAVHTLAELKSKRVGISSSGSLTDWIAKKLAAHEGWGPDDLNRVTIGNQAAAVIAAFRTNAIDADVAATTNIFKWHEKQEARLLAPVTSFIGNMAAGTIYASQHVMAEEPDALRRFLAAWIESVNYLATHKSEAVKIYSDVTGASEKVMSEEYDLTTSAFRRDCKFDAQSLAGLKGAFADQKLLETSPDMTKLYTEAYLPKQ